MPLGAEPVVPDFSWSDCCPNKGRTREGGAGQREREGRGGG